MLSLLLSVVLIMPAYVKMLFFLITSILCAWTKVLPAGEVHYSFLRRSSRPASPSLRLYHSSWSEERALLGCAWSDEAAVIRNYFTLCRERAHHFSDHPDENLDVDSIFEAEDQCVSLAPAGRRSVRSVNGHEGEDGRSEGRIHQRVKRSFIVPGTLWCGSGNKAPSYQDLGVFAETDSCCREHDHCKHTILSFHSDFGLFNSNIFTMSHCDCDNKFHSCLKEAKDSISDVVGYTFFNLLKMHCFDFSHRLQCAQRNWFGMCKESKMDLYAVVHPPTLYESPAPTELNSTNSTTNITLPEELQKSGTSHPQLFPITAEGETVHTPSTGAPSATITHAINKQLSCADYKVLDECKTKLLPKQRRYGLRNPEAMTLYHCNCTTSTSTSNCAFSLLNSCTAALVRAELPELNLRRSADVEKQRHLQADNMQGRGPNSGRGQRKQGAVSLHKLCLRGVQTKNRPENILSMHTSPL
uniref:phospholipase A2 n=1 Tax=Mola mola TaxID=94237 RepID=A0A3Q3WSW3_MOLML